MSVDLTEYNEDQSYMLSGRTLNLMVRAIKQNRVINSPDIEVKEASGGLILTLVKKSGSAIEEEYPFKLRPSGAGFTVQPGTVAGQMPTISGVALTANPILAVPSGTAYVLIKVNVSYVTNAAETLVLGGTVTSVEIIASSTIPVATWGSGVGSDYLLLAMCEDKMLLHGQYLRRSLSISICDNGLGTGEPTLAAGGLG